MLAKCECKKNDEFFWSYNSKARFSRKVVKAFEQKVLFMKESESNQNSKSLLNIGSPSFISDFEREGEGGKGRKLGPTRGRYLPQKVGTKKKERKAICKRRKNV